MNGPSKRAGRRHGDVLQMPGCGHGKKFTPNLIVVLKVVAHINPASYVITTKASFSTLPLCSRPWTFVMSHPFLMNYSLTYSMINDVSRNIIKSFTYWSPANSGICII